MRDEGIVAQLGNPCRVSLESRIGADCPLATLLGMSRLVLLELWESGQTKLHT